MVTFYKILMKNFSNFRKWFVKVRTVMIIIIHCYIYFFIFAQYSMIDCPCITYIFIIKNIIQGTRFVAEGGRYPPLQHNISHTVSMFDEWLAQSWWTLSCVQCNHKTTFSKTQFIIQDVVNKNFCKNVLFLCLKYKQSSSSK